MGDIAGGESFIDGQTVPAARLNNDLNSAVIQPSFISSKPTDVPVDADFFLFFQQGTSAFKKVLAQSLRTYISSSYTAHGDSNYTILTTDKVVALNTNLTAPRTWALPTAASFGAGNVLVIVDEWGGISAGNYINVAASGGAKIGPASASNVYISVKGGCVVLVCDGTNWGIISQTPSLQSMQILTAGVAYTPPAGTKAIFVECLGGGGAGGGAGANAGQSNGGGGGGSGAYSSVFSGIVKSAYTIAIGSGGLGAAGLVGGNGGDTTFDSPSICTAKGGQGGAVLSTGNTIDTAFGGVGGLASAGIGLNKIDGNPGGYSYRSGGVTMCLGGGGSAAPVLGGGAAPPTRGAGTGTFVGTAAAAYGAGGGGGVCIDGGGLVAGGNGSGGMIRVWEFY